MGAKIITPQRSFFELVARAGLPNRFRRHCCNKLKEYKVQGYEKVVMGVRRAESTKRAQRYKEPTECRWYGSRKNPEKYHIEAIYPILDWEDRDVLDFIIDREIKLNPHYYREDGTIDIKRRVGCIGCPLATPSSRAESFEKYNKFLVPLARAASEYFRSHPDSPIEKRYDGDAYAYLLRNIFFEEQAKWNNFFDGLDIEGKRPDCKKILEERFHIQLPTL